MAKSETDALVVLESFIGRLGDEDVMFRKGDLINPTNPAIKKWPDKFGAAEYRHEPRVEQATAAPGEKRAG